MKMDQKWVIFGTPKVQKWSKKGHFWWFSGNHGFGALFSWFWQNRVISLGNPRFLKKVIKTVPNWKKSKKVEKTRFFRVFSQKTRKNTKTQSNIRRHTTKTTRTSMTLDMYWNHAIVTVRILILYYRYNNKFWIIHKCYINHI